MALLHESEIAEILSPDGHYGELVKELVRIGCTRLVRLGPGRLEVVCDDHFATVLTGRDAEALLGELRHRYTGTRPLMPHRAERAECD
jgi:hypothetical protein